MFDRILNAIPSFQVNSDRSLLPNVTLALRWNDTRGDTVVATRAITEMICDGIATIFGPEGACHVEAIVSQSRNIPMISYVCILAPMNREYMRHNELINLLIETNFRNVRITRHHPYQHLHAQNLQILR